MLGGRHYGGQQKAYRGKDSGDLLACMIWLHGLIGGLSYPTFEFNARYNGVGILEYDRISGRMFQNWTEIDTE
jgi:hypothetical protein